MSTAVVVVVVRKLQSKRLRDDRWQIRIVPKKKNNKLSFLAYSYSVVEINYAPRTGHAIERIVTIRGAARHTSKKWLLSHRVTVSIFDRSLSFLLFFPPVFFRFLYPLVPADSMLPNARISGKKASFSSSNHIESLYDNFLPFAASLFIFLCTIGYFPRYFSTVSKRKKKEKEFTYNYCSDP